MKPSPNTKPNFFNPEPRDPKRIEPMLAKIEELWKKTPQLRLGQFLGNCVSDIQLFYIEDEDLLTRLEAMYREADKD